MILIFTGIKPPKGLEDIPQFEKQAGKSLVHNKATFIITCS